VTRHLVFLPHQPTPWNVPLSAVTAMFLHGDTGHLWGNMLFLWAVGTVVERRIGWRPFLVAYLGTGIAAGLVAAAVPWLLTGITQHGLGASGAISGIMGVFAVRCYFKTMVFPIPLLGIFSLVIPFNVKLHVNSLVVITLFFLADLSGGIDQVSGSGFSAVGHWAHLGGMVAGFGLAMWLSLGSAAAQERHLDIGGSAAEAGIGVKAGRESLQRVLEKEPENPEALLSLARLESRHHPSDEGRLAYEKCIEVLGPVDPPRAAEVFREGSARYRIAVEPQLQYRLSAHLFRMGDLELASRSLESLVEGTATPPDVAEKALFQLGRIYELMGLAEAARDAYRRYADTYPDSHVAEKARARAAALG
jgi:membrane associated rhomboid family serine protease